MLNQRHKLGLFIVAVMLATAAIGWWGINERNKVCCAFPNEPEPPSVKCANGYSSGDTEPPPPVALMTSLPIYWPEGEGFEALASGEVEVPWQRAAIEQCYSLVPIDTLSEDANGVDPLMGVEQLAVIQPRGLSPADNVALDDWVRSGGKLLLVLDPMLTGDYEYALGDPRRPADTALIPPVVQRWGLSISFDQNQAGKPSLIDHEEGALVRSMTGEIYVAPDRQSDCDLAAESMLAQCRVGEGSVVLAADAATFEVEPREPSPVERHSPPLVIRLFDLAFN